MITMPRVSNSDQFTAFMDFAKAELPSVHARIWAAIKQDLDLVHFDYCFGDDSAVEQAAAGLLEFAEARLADLAGQLWVDEFANRLGAFKLHGEVAQAMDMEPWEQEAVWAAWERSDAQSAFQDKLDMYRNEH